ncbi:Neur chan LBD domain containing protein, partial [Asbolus verrucosus]
MRVVDINSINVEDMDFRMDMFIKQQWIDIRIKIPEEMFEYGDESVTLPSQFFENLWQPDLYFLNSKVVEIATLTHKFSSVTLYRNKTISYAARMHAIVACQMEFQHYPMDTQLCPISVESCE